MFFTSRDRNATHALLGFLSTCSIIANASVAQAQEAADLPPLLVEGATIDKPKAKVRASAVQSQPSSGGSQAATPTTSAPAAASAADEAGSAPVSEGVPADQVGSAITIVTAAQLKAQQVRSAADALRSLPGVSVSRTGGFGGLTQVRIRGAEGNHTLVLIDGVEANDTGQGEFDFSDLSADDIEQIEVIRGGYSGIYGSGAIGGVINIVTRKGKGPLTVSGYAEGGSFNTKGGNVRVSGGTDRLWGVVSISQRKTDGFDIAPFGSEDDGSKLATFNFRGGAQLAKGLTLDLSVRHVDKDGDRDTQDPFPSISGIQVDDPATFNTNIWLGAAKLTWDSANGAFSTSLKAAHNRTERDDDDPLGGFFGRNDSERTTYAYTATVRTPDRTFLDSKHALTGLVEHEEELFTPNTFATGPFGFPPDGTERERNRWAYAAEYRVDFSDRLFLTGDLRFDDNDVFEDFTTWRVSGVYKIPELGLRPHASVGTSVKFPTMFEQFGSIPAFFNPNPDLLPEESFGWDAGVEISLLKGLASLDVTYFRADLENEIRGVGFPTTPINLLGKSERQGIEVAGRWNLTRQLTLGASYTYLDATDPDGAEEIRRPPHAGRLDANYVFASGRGNFNVAAIYNGDMKDLNFGPTNLGLTAETVTLQDYWLITAAASYEINPGVEIFGRVENALDENYQEVFGFETAGAAAYAGMRFKFSQPEAMTR